MRLLTARHFALAVLAPALLIFAAVPGCSNESEGQRCGDDAYGPNNDDCASGLVCIPAAMLLNSNGANRCCFQEASNVSDSRCTRTTSIATGTGGSAGATSGGSGGSNSAGTGGAATTGGTSAAASAGASGAPDAAAAAGAGGN
jgi:hypothetical protein